MDMGLLVGLFPDNSGGRSCYQHQCRGLLLLVGGSPYSEPGNGNAHKDFF